VALLLSGGLASLPARPLLFIQGFRVTLPPPLSRLCYHAAAVLGALLAMENCGRRGASWDLGLHWTSAGSCGYPQQQPFVLRPGGGPSRDHQQEQTWLNLGKRPCCWAGDCQTPPQPSGGGHAVHGNGGAGGGRGTAAAAESEEKAAAAAAVVVPRCQVEGCHVALSGAKEYHRRHKVCEAHSKASRVVVLGAEQRFCQQCSRSVRL
jgi:hypothetical protein